MTEHEKSKAQPTQDRVTDDRLGKELEAGRVCTDQPTETVHLLSVHGLQLFIAFYSNRCFSGSFSHTSVFYLCLIKNLQTFLSGMEIANDTQAVAISREGHCNISGRGRRYTLH